MLRREGHPVAMQPPASGCDPALGSGFGCEDCGSPAVLLPSDLRSQSLVVCDRCQRPVATLAEFRAYVERLIRETPGCASM